MDRKERKEEEEGRREENILNEPELINYIILFMIFFTDPRYNWNACFKKCCSL